MYITRYKTGKNKLHYVFDTTACNITFLLFFTVFAGRRNEDLGPVRENAIIVPCSQQLHKLGLRFPVTKTECAQVELWNISCEGLGTHCEGRDYIEYFGRNKES